MFVGLLIYKSCSFPVVQLHFSDSRHYVNIVEEVERL